MKRYSLHDPYFESELRECADGYLVDYEDVEKLQQQNADLLAALKEITKVNESSAVKTYQRMEEIALNAIAKTEGKNT